MNEKPRKVVPSYEGTLRGHMITVPTCISEAYGIRVFGRRIKSIVFSTDIAIIRNINADAVIAVYPFTPQPVINRAILQSVEMPVFAGIGGGLTGGTRSVRLGCDAEDQGACGVVVNAPIGNDIISRIKEHLDIPIVATVVTESTDIKARIDAGVSIVNVAGSWKTPRIVKAIRTQFPQLPIIATGGPTDEMIMETIAAGANAITFTPPSTAELFASTMEKYRRDAESDS